MCAKKLNQNEIHSKPSEMIFLSEIMAGTCRWIECNEQWGAFDCNGYDMIPLLTEYNCGKIWLFLVSFQCYEPHRCFCIWQWTRSDQNLTTMGFFSSFSFVVVVVDFQTQAIISFKHLCWCAACGRRSRGPSLMPKRKKDKQNASNWSAIQVKYLCECCYQISKQSTSHPGSLRIHWIENYFGSFEISGRVEPMAVMGYDVDEIHLVLFVE